MADNKQNILFYNSTKVSHSQESNIIFVTLANESTYSQIIALSYRQAARLAQDILEQLNHIGFGKNEEAVNEIQYMPSQNNPNPPDSVMSVGNISDRTKIKSPMASNVLPEKFKRVVLNPSSTTAELHQQFNSGSPEVRFQVVRLLARRKDLQGLQIIYKATTDQDERVRRLATEALGLFPCQHTIQILSKQLNDQDDIVRLKAVESLGKIGDKKIISSLKNMITDHNLAIRRRVVDLLSAISDDNMITTLAQILKDEDVQIRLVATQALAKIGGPIAASSLVIAIKDSSATVRENAVKALGDIGNLSFVPILLNILTSQDQDEVRKCAVEALGKLGDSTGIKQMVRMLKNEDESIDVRSAIANTIGKLGCHTELPVLVSLLKSNSSILRMNGAIAIGKLKDSTPASTLRYILEIDTDAHVRGASAWALGEIGDKNSLPILHKSLLDKNSNVRASAAEAIGKIGDKASIDELEKIADDRDDFVRSRVLQAIRMIQLGG